MIENYGYSDGGIYYSTYANTGHFSRVSAGADLSYRLSGDGSMPVGAGKPIVIWGKMPKTLLMLHLALTHK